MLLTKPMLAAPAAKLEDIKLPALCTPKLDGIRCVKKGEKVLSRTFKPIPNRHISGMIKELPQILDGEIIIPGVDFNGTQSAVMSRDGDPDFRFYVFDHLWEEGAIYDSYHQRMETLRTLKLPKWCVKLLPVRVINLAQLVALEQKYLNEGYEGIMARNEFGGYKCGRSTLREGLLIKYKRFEDSEAEIIDFEELETNTNAKETNEVGYSKRSSKKSGKVAADTLGAIVVRDIHTGVEHRIGTGFTQQQRDDFWSRRKKLVGKIVCYKWQKAGAKDKPRFPSFKGFRDKRDIS